MGRSVLALLNTRCASGVTDFVIANQLRPVETPFGPQPPNEALVHRYTVAFFWAAVLLASLVGAAVLITAPRTTSQRRTHGRNCPSRPSLRVSALVGSL